MLQQVPEPKVCKNRMHVDLVTDDIPTEVDTSTIIDHQYLDKAAEIGCGA